MKRYDGLWEQIVDFEVLLHAYEDARKKRHFQHEIMGVGSHIEETISDMVLELNCGTWRPHAYYDFESRREVKRRVINAPSFRDRILHRAIVDAVRPLFERKFIYDSYASMTGKGTHAAIKRLQHFLRSAANSGRVYVLQCDISHYYDTVDHEVLKRIIRQTIKDKRLLEVWDRIIDSYGSDGKGIPIGALTSQLAANVYLNVLDHFVKECMRVKRYLRYMDDFIIVANSKADLWRNLADIKWLLECHLKLKLNRRTKVFPASRGVDFCGYRTWSTHILPRKRNIKAAKIRFKQLTHDYKRGVIDLDDVKPRVASFLGYTKHCQAKQTTISTLRWLKGQRGEYHGNKKNANHDNDRE